MDGAADLSMAMIFCFKDLQTLLIDPMYVWRAALASGEGVEPGARVILGESYPPNNDEYPEGTAFNGNHTYSYILIHT